MLERKRIAAASLAAVAGVVSGQQPPVGLGRVVVTASGFEQAVIDAPASVTIITREQLESRRVSNLTEALQGIEGINVRPLDARDGKTGNQSVSLRGLPREYTLVLIDGVRQNPLGNITPNSFNDSQSAFIPPVAAIQRIEVIRGPMSTLYGSDALGGVVNIITRKPGQAWNAVASVARTFQSGSEFGDKTTAEAFAGGPVGEALSLQAYGRYFDRQRSNIAIPGVALPRGINADTPTMGQNPVAADNYVAGAKLSWAFGSRHRLGLAANVTEQEYDNEFGDVGALHRTGAPSGSACNTRPFPNFCRGYQRALEFSRKQLTASYEGDFEVGTLYAAYTRDELETVGRTIPLNSGLQLAAEGSPRTLELTTDIVDLRFVMPLGQHTVVLGGQYLRPEMTDGLWGGASNQLRQYSLFVEDEWRLTDRFRLTGGVRYDDNDAFSGQFTPRLYGIYRASAEWTIKGGVAQGFRSPYLEQLTNGIIGFGNQGTVPLFGNPGLEPETSTNVEASATYAGAQLVATATVFNNTLTNLVEAGTGANTGRSLNIGEARIRGVEISAAWRASPDVTVGANYTYLDSEVTETQQDTGNPAQLIASRRGDPLVSVPAHMLNARVDWQATALLRTFVSVEYRSSAYRPRNFHEPQTGGSSQGAVAPGVRDSNVVLGDFKGFTQVDLGAAMRLGKHMTLTGVVYNLLNTDFKDYVSYSRCANAGCTAFATGFSNRFNNIFEPRRFYLAIGIEL